MYKMTVESYRQTRGRKEKDKAKNYYVILIMYQQKSKGGETPEDKQEKYCWLPSTTTSIREKEIQLVGEDKMDN